MSGGKKANQSGKSWESWVQLTAQQLKFKILKFSEREKHLPLKPNDRFVWLRAPYRTIYDTKKIPKANSEFVFETVSERIRVECKWQKGSGSVDEKYLFMYLNGVLTVEEPTVIFALGGNHFFINKRGIEIREWLTEVCTNPPKWLSEEAIKRWKSKKLIVLTNNNFNDWFTDKFPV